MLHTHVYGSPWYHGYFLHRCLVPENLTDTIKVQLQSFLDPDCNYSAPTPQPSTASLTLTLTATSPCEFYYNTSGNCVLYMLHKVHIFSIYFTYSFSYQPATFTVKASDLCYGGSVMCGVCVPGDGCAHCTLCLVQEVWQTQGTFMRRSSSHLHDIVHVHVTNTITTCTSKLLCTCFLCPHIINLGFQTGSIGSLPTFDDADLLEETTNMTSGSGSGQRLLEQRTIARQIKKIEIVGMSTKTIHVHFN